MALHADCPPPPRVGRALLQFLHFSGIFVMSAVLARVAPSVRQGQ